MGLFDVFKKQDCEICGKEVGMLGYKKLEDGQICKDCLKLLSPWFDERRHSTVEQIKAQIAYREENRNNLSSFRPDISIGNNYEVKIQLENGVPARFVITRGNYLEENADIIEFSQVTSFSIDIREDRDEEKYRNNEGNMVSYNPPRYEYSYDFYCDLMVNADYFDDIRFRLNQNTLNLQTVMQNNTGFGGLFMNNTFDPNLYPEYREFKAMCDQLQEIFNAGMQRRPIGGFAQAAPVMPNYSQPVQQVPVQQAPVQQAAGPKFCPNCGTPSDGGKFCQSCGTAL